MWHLLRSMRGGSVPEFPESPFSRLDAESETGQFWISSPIPSPVLTWFEHRDRFWVLSREPRLFQPETPILHIKPVEISPNSKSETRDNLTLSPSPSLRLGDPGTSRPSPSPRRVWRRGTRTFESETRDSGKSRNSVHRTLTSGLYLACYNSIRTMPMSGYIFALCLPTLFRSRGLSTSAGMNWAWNASLSSTLVLGSTSTP